MKLVFRSLPSPDALAEIVGRCYGLHVASCELVRSFVNDIYVVVTPHQGYVLKVYRHGGWSLDEVTWELELVAHLDATDVAVARAIPLLDGRWAGTIDAPEGPRPFALSEYVDGEKPQPPFDEGLYRDFGRLIARFHRAGEGFRGRQRRPPFDLTRTLDNPIAGTLPALTARPADRALIGDLAAAARRRVAEFAGEGLDWGIRHGDVSLDNVHLTGRGLVLHDFDLAGEGWRAADLTGVWSTPFWDAFLAGYRELRPLNETDLAALPWLRVIEVISNLRFHLVDKPAFRGTESLTEGWIDRELSALRTLASEKLRFDP